MMDAAGPLHSDIDLPSHNVHCFPAKHGGGAGQEEPSVNKAGPPLRFPPPGLARPGSAQPDLACQDEVDPGQSREPRFALSRRINTVPAELIWVNWGLELPHRRVSHSWEGLHFHQLPADGELNCSHFLESHSKGEKEPGEVLQHYFRLCSQTKPSLQVSSSTRRIVGMRREEVVTDNCMSRSSPSSSSSSPSSPH